MHPSLSLGRSLVDHRRSTLLTLAAALCVALALSISAAAAPAHAAFHKEAYHDDSDGFMCPVHTVVDGGFRTHWYPDGSFTRQLHLTTSITTGYNGYIFAACRASVYVDVLSANGDILGTLDFYPWAGGLSTNHEQHDDVVVPLEDSEIPLVRSIQIRQYPRYA